MAATGPPVRSTGCSAASTETGLRASERTCRPLATALPSAGRQRPRTGRTQRWTGSTPSRTARAAARTGRPGRVTETPQRTTAAPPAKTASSRRADSWPGVSRAPGPAGRLPDARTRTSRTGASAPNLAPAQRAQHAQQRVGAPRWRRRRAHRPAGLCRAAACSWLERGVGEGAVSRVDRDAGRDDLVDPVEHIGRQDHVGRGQLRLQLLHRARADQRRGDGRMRRPRTRWPAGSA